MLLICFGSLVVGRNVDEYKYEKPEYHHDEPNNDGYIMVDGYPEGEESYYYEDGSTADTHYHYPEEEAGEREEKREEYHIEYAPNHEHVPENHHYERHYVHEEREHNGQKLVKTDYNYERKNNQVVVQSEEVPTAVAHEHEPEKKPNPNPPSKRVHIKLPEFDYSSYSKTDSEIQYEKPPVEKPKKEMKRYHKIGKHQYVPKGHPSHSRYENVQRVPANIEYPRERGLVRQRIRIRPSRPQIYQVPYKQKLPEVIVTEDGHYKEDVSRRTSGKPRRIPVRTTPVVQEKDHVLYYVDQPVQVYDPKEKKFHQFDKLSEKEAEEIKKETQEKIVEYKEEKVAGVEVAEEKKD